jgi:hypothetical protein
MNILMYRKRAVFIGRAHKEICFVARSPNHEENPYLELTFDIFFQEVFRKFLTLHMLYIGSAS